MNARDERMDWNRPSQAFRHFDGSLPEIPPRVTTPAPHRVANLDAWRASPAVRKERRRGIVIGFALAMVVYGLGSAVLVLAFHALGVRP